MAVNDRLDSPVLDFSAHFYPNIPARMENINLHRVLRATEGPIYKDFAATQQRLMDGGVDGAILSCPAYFNHDNLEETRAGNDNLLDVIEDEPDYYALASLPVGHHIEAAATEFERCLDEGFNGGVLETWGHTQITTAALEPIFSVADRREAPLYIHPKIHGSLGPEVFSEPEFPHTNIVNEFFGRGIALCECICLMVLQGLFERYDRLTLVVHHVGGNLASHIGKIEGILEKRRTDPVYEHASELMSYEDFERHLREHVYVDTAGYFGDPDVYRRAIDVFSADHVLFGSDYPCYVRTGEDFRRHLEGIEAVVPPEDRARIFGENALDVLANV